MFRVLNTTANGSKTNGGSLEPALLLLTEYDIFKENQQWDDTDPYGQVWSTDSSLRTMLNNSSTDGGTLKDCFDTREIAKIMTTYNSENSTISNDNPDNIYWGNADNSRWAYGCGLEGEQLFLLSAKEAVNNTYGFATIEDGANKYSFEGGFADGNRIAKRGDAAGSSIHWWLRSAYSGYGDGVAHVLSGGALDADSNNTGGVRFALNIPLSSIIYTSAATEGSSSSQMAQITSQAKSEAASAKGVEPTAASKLVLKDSSRDSFQVTEPTVTRAPEGTFTLNYTGAKTNSNSTNEYISLIIKDENGEGLYYETLQENTTADDEDGTVSVTLPDLEVGDYTLMVLNEQRNPEKETNYAGYDTVALSVVSDATAPTYSEAYKCGTKALITATDSGIGLSKIVATNDADATAITGGTFTGSEATQTIICTLPSEDTTTVYVVDKAGNIAPVTLTEDATAGDVTITRTGKTTFTVDVANSLSGLVNIKQLNTSGTSVQTTNFNGTRPTSGTLTNVSLNSAAIRVQVFNAVGGSTTVQIPQLELSSDTTITADELNGIKLTGDNMTLTIDGNVKIGDQNKACAGIEIKENITVKIDVTSGKTATIWGGIDRYSGINYLCYAGIYVPETSSVIINESGTGTLSVESRGRAAGIGGHGPSLYTTEMSPDTANAGSIYIKGGTVDASISFFCNGQGAAIGGGGLWIDAGYTGTSLTSGSVERVEISGGNVIATVTSQTNYCSGKGAGIGSGGICNNSASLTTLKSGDVKNVIITGGTVTANGGSGGEKVYGSGAGIGSGAVQSSKTIVNVGVGSLINLKISNDASINTITATGGQGSTNTYGKGANIGTGGIRNNTTNINGTEYDATAPTVTSTSYSQGKITIVATDDKIGLWKISTTADPTVAGVYTSYNNETPPTAETTAEDINCVGVDKFYVFDRLGNNAEVTRETAEPQATKAYKKGATAIVTAEGTGSAPWKIVATNEDAINAQALYTFSGEATTQTAIFDLPEATTSEVYIVDGAGNVSTAIPLELDTEAPTAVIDNSGEVSKLIVTDSGSGIKRVGQTPYTDYPATVTITPAPLSVEVEDAFGNVKTYTTKKVLVTAEDTGTGLWKVVATPSITAEPIALFEDSEETSQTLIFTVMGDLETVYVVDNAGNVSEGYTLIPDETAPTGAVSYNEGIITLTVTDNYSGVARIGNTEYDTYPTETSTPIPSGTTAMEVEDALGNEDELQLSLDNQAPTGENGYARIDNSGESPVKKGVITVQEVGISGLWKVIEEDANISNNPTIEQIRNATALTTTFVGEDSTKKATFTLTDTTKANVYVVDHAGNISTAIPLSVETAEPEELIDAEINYGTTPISITVTADGVGIARIENTEYPTYPESQTYVIETMPESGIIEIEDALGNIRRIYIDNQAPVVTKGYARIIGETTYVTVKATDEGTGLWKIVKAENWTDADVIYTYTETNATQIVRFEYNGTDLGTVYVVDKMGNVSEGFTLVVDNQAPTVTKGYVRTITE